MKLPEQVLTCIQTLEAAGYKAYCVGGCVRDSMLGLMPQDYDLCTDATPDVTAALFAGHTLVRSGEKHGTIGVVFGKTVYEITTFRTEGGYLDNRHPDWVQFVPNVAEDLARRDFTVNAMAYNPKEGLVDPSGGQQDLNNQVLRAVGEPEVRFTEDALRILRGVRFALRFRLTPESATKEAMFRLAPLMDKLARERVFEELCKLIIRATADDLLTYAPILTQVIPELGASVGFSQCSPHHAFDVFTHTAYVVENVPPVLPLRLAALLHDMGKPQVFTLDENGRGHFKQHAPTGAEMADAVLRRLKAPTALREQVVFLIEKHMTPLEPDRKLLRRRLGQYGQENCRLLLQLQEADFRSKGVPTNEAPPFDAIRDLLDTILREADCLHIRDLAVDGKDLMALGIPAGPQLGKLLECLLEQVQQETLPNEKEALLKAAEAIQPSN